MMIQIPYMQRFSVYLGHPTYAIAVILFSMILFTGIGSSISDYAPVEAHPSLIYGIALVIAVAVLVDYAINSIDHRQDNPISDRRPMHDRGRDDRPAVSFARLLFSNWHATSGKSIGVGDAMDVGSQRCGGSALVGSGCGVINVGRNTNEFFCCSRLLRRSRHPGAGPVVKRSKACREHGIRFHRSRILAKLTLSPI